MSSAPPSDSPPWQWEQQRAAQPQPQQQQQQLPRWQTESSFSAGVPPQQEQVPAWQRDSRFQEQAPGSETKCQTIAFIIPGIFCLLFLTLFAIVGLAMPRWSFRTKTTKTHVAKLYTSKIVFDFRHPTNSSIEPLEKTVSIGDWDTIPYLGEAAGWYKFALAVGIISIIILVTILLIQFVRFCALKDGNVLLGRLMAGGVIFVFVIGLVVNVTLAFAARKSFEDFKDKWLEVRVGEAVEARGRAGEQIISLIALLISVWLLAFSIRTLVGRRCQSCCCECCGCSLMTEPPLAQTESSSGDVSVYPQQQQPGVGGPGVGGPPAQGVVVGADPNYQGVA